MTVWAVKSTENPLGHWSIEKIFQKKKDAIAYCEKMNASRMPYLWYDYSKYEVE